MRFKRCLWSCTCVGVVLVAVVNMGECILCVVAELVVGGCAEASVECFK